jgi:hypothetical protein
VNDDSFREACEENDRKRAKVIPLNGKTTPARAFPLTSLGLVKMSSEDRNYAVKGLLPRAGLAVVWGPPKSGKSF